MSIHVLIGEILMAIGLLVMLCGFVGLIRFQTFYRRLLVSSLVDTVGLVILLAGAVIRQGLTAFSGKLILIMAVILLTAPLVTHKLGRSAFLSRHAEGDSND